MHKPQPSEKNSLHCPVKTLAVYSSRQPGLVSTTCAAHASSGHILTDRQTRPYLENRKITLMSASPLRHSKLVSSLV